MPISRLGAFLIHLGISACIFAALAYLVIFVWYPDFFFASDGGWQGLRIIASVDLVLGPLLTLAVFNRSKPQAELRRDLGIIGTVQAVCLIAGTWIVYAERPLALVYADGQFFSMSADDYRETGIEPPDLSEFPGPYPKRVVVEIPDDPSVQAELRLDAWRSGRPIRALVEHYAPMRYPLPQADREALQAEQLERHEAATGDLTRWLANHGGTTEDYDFFRFGARYGYLILGVDRRGRVLGPLATPLNKRDGPRSGLPQISDR